MPRVKVKCIRGSNASRAVANSSRLHRQLLAGTDQSRFLGQGSHQSLVFSQMSWSLSSTGSLCPLWSDLGVVYPRRKLRVGAGVPASIFLGDDLDAGKKLFEFLALDSGGVDHRGGLRLGETQMRDQHPAPTAHELRGFDDSRVLAGDD